MDIRVLRYYLAVCSEGTMSKAAQVCHVTQPTLSRQIADLEREMGCTLLERGARQVKLTEKGFYLRRRAEEIVALADQTQDDLKAGEGIVEGDVRIGAGESLGVRAVAAVIRAFREEHPQVRFRFHSGNAVEVTERLEHGLIDLAVLIDYSDIARYEHMRLRPTDAWCVLVPTDSPLAAKDAISPDDLAGLPLIVSEQALERDTLSGWFGAHMGELNVVATYNLVFNAVMLARERVGCVLTLDGLTTLGPESGLVSRTLFPPVVSPIDVAWIRGQPRTLAVDRFIAALRVSV